jgi:hypothetical protein
LPIGAPTADSPFAGAGTFVPHVALRNLSGSPQNVIVTIEYPQPAAADGTSASPNKSATPADAKPNFTPAPAAPGDPSHHPEWGAGTGTTTGTITLGPFPVGAYSSVDYSLASALSGLPAPVPYCSIGIQYSGAPASLQAQVTSVESNSNLIIDSHVQNEGNGWAGSGANPWHLDEDTESILFLTNESAQTARMGFSVTANNTHYYLTELQLGPHETRAIDLRKLRDAQLPDLKGNKIPATATDGSVIWQRLDKVPVMGRLMVINRRQGMASNYDCCICACPADYYGDNEINPATAYLPIEGSQGLINNAQYYTCNLGDYYVNVTAASLWSSAYPNIASVNTAGTVKGQSAGTTGVTGQYSSYYYGWVLLHAPFDFGCEEYPQSGNGNNTTNVTSVSQSPSTFNMSTGDTGQISVTVNPSNLPVTLSFSGTSSPTSNPNSSGAVTLTISGSGSGTINSSVTASPAGKSGVFSVTASAGGVQSTNSTTVNVPPQAIIQMVQAEAGGTNNTTMRGVAWVPLNRIQSPIFDPPYSNFQNTVVSGQFVLSSTTTGIEPELDIATGVFTETSGDSSCNSLAFWTPTSAQWSNVQSAITSQTTSFPSNTGAPTYSSWSTQNQQIVYNTAVSTQSNGAPSFLFLRYRQSAVAAAVQTTCN